MTMRGGTPKACRGPLPRELRELFWEHDARRLRLDLDRDLVIGRILAAGSWEAIVWLRREVGDAELRQWLLDRQGAGLTPQQLRYWQLILDLPPRRVDSWLRQPARAVWDRRSHA